MHLAHLQQQIKDLRQEKSLDWVAPGFHKQIVLWHSNISGIAVASQHGNDQELSRELAKLLIKIVHFPALFPEWNDIWGSQTLKDFSPDITSHNIWDLLYKMHQLVSGLVGGRSDIILLYKLIQVIRATALLLELDLPRAVKGQMDYYWQHGQQQVN